VRGKPPSPLLSSKWARKPSTFSLLAFDASKLPPNVPKRPNRHRKERRRLGQLDLVPLAPSPTPRARGLTIEIASTSAVASSLITILASTTPSKKSKNPIIIKPFNPNNCWDKEPYYVQITITPNMEGKRKDRDLIILSIDLSDCVCNKLKDL